MSAYIDNVKLLLFMSENIGKLTTPSGDGARIEVTENIININKTIRTPNGFIDVISEEAINNNLSELLISSGDEYLAGGYIALRSLKDELLPGGFLVGCKNKDNLNVSLTGHIDPNTNKAYLFFNSKLIDSIYSFGDNYIQYTNGLLICWGYIQYTLTNTIVNFPIAYIRNPSVITGNTGDGTGIANADIITTTGFTYKAINSSVSGYYLSIGYWK